MQPRPDPSQSKDNDESAVRFPATGKPRVVKRRLPRLRDLLPRRWRRVVIQGQHYWLPSPS